MIVHQDTCLMNRAHRNQWLLSEETAFDDLYCKQGEDKKTAKVIRFFLSNFFYCSENREEIIICIICTSMAMYVCSQP